MKKTDIFILPLAAVLATACVKESFPEGKVVNGEPLNPEKIQSGVLMSDMGVSSGDTLSLTFIAPGSNAETKALIVDSGKEAVYDCQVIIDGHVEGSNPIVANSSAGTKSIFGINSTNAIPCNFLRIDENYDSDHTALYTFPTYNHAILLEGEVSGAPESSSKVRSITLNPEQSYNYFTKKFSETANDSIFYHTRLVGWHPAMCKLPQDGKAVEFGNTRYSNYIAYLDNRYGVVFNHTLDGATDIVMSNLGQSQRWHSNSAPATGKRDNRYRDLAKHLLDTNYCTPFGYNQDQAPKYSNSLHFKHYLSAVRIWAKVAQDTSSTLNLSTWGKILSLTFVDQPSSCTVLLPTEVGESSFGTLLEDSWTDYSNHSAQGGLIYGEGDIEIPLSEDYQVTYPIDMTQSQAEMSKKYLGYSLIQPGQDIVIAIQTSAGTYQAVLPHKILESGKSDSTSIFQGGMIYDVVLNLETKGSVAEFIENEDTGSYVDLSPWDPSPDKQEFKTANCYIVDVNEVQATLDAFRDIGSEDVPGYCFLGTVLGNGESGIMSRGISTFHTNTATIDTPASAKVVWQSELGLISNVHLQHGYIRFNVPQARKGNAVIAAMDASGTIVWSWHIWITDTPGVIKTSQEYNYMDRNLGAITTTDGDVIPDNSAEALKLYGLYYQWGRKDPLPGPLKYDQSGGQSMRITPVYNTYGEKVTSLGNYIYNQGQLIEESIEKPMHYLINPSSPYYNYNWMSEKIDFLWGEEVSGTGGSSYYQKTIYDPCPYGYHVPAEEVQYLAETADTVIYSNPYGLFLENVFLPYAGYYGPDRNQTSNDGASYYCGSKGDYQSSVICSDEDGVDYSWFRNHRLRTYISYATDWVEQNTDGSSTFTYKAPDHFVTTSVVRTHHDYTNRRTAASVRCVKETNYALNIEARMTPSTRSVKQDKDTDVTFTLEGRTNKGVIKSANLVIHYKKKSDGSAVTWLTQDLTDKTQAPSAIITSKTLSGTSTITIPASIVSDADSAKIFARLDLVVAQGSATTSKSSTEYLLMDGFVLTLLLNTDGTGSLTHAYCIDPTETFTVTLPGGTEESREYPTTRLVNYKNMYPPVIGQPTTITAYVNATDATVTIDGGVATIDASKGKFVNEEWYYPYSVTKKTWTSKGWKNLEISATKSGYGVATDNVSVPVYGINVNTSNKIDQGSTTRLTVKEENGVQKNWYVFYDNGYLGNSGYSNFNGLNIKQTDDESAINYRYLMGFEKASGNSRIFNAFAGLEHPIAGDTRGSKLVVAVTKESGTQYVLGDYDVGLIWKTYYVHMKTTGGLYWQKYLFSEYQINNSSIAAGIFWFYPVTFSVD